MGPTCLLHGQNDVILFYFILLLLSLLFNILFFLHYMPRSPLEIVCRGLELVDPHTPWSLNDL